ncbi:hypothetical protein N431DRAFT_437599 [Stipitochalara longipes BDJ]|nr:hypothetical protein N431DRAFT_435649 [Stipitochalara longipes BDJ]KAE9374055.1 hypothetical protein N431DRAFT_437599 [Stipitochalara longipes BDJ]
MGLVRHPISAFTTPPGTDITVGPAAATLQWELVRERANQTLSELLLLVLELVLIVLFLALGIVRFLRSVVESGAFGHVDSFLSPAQEARTPASSSGLSSSPVSSSLPASSRGPSLVSPLPESSSTTQPPAQLSSLESSSSPELLITSRSSVLESFINESSLKSAPSSSLPRSSLPRSPRSSSSLPVPVPVPAPPSVSSSLPRSSLPRFSLRPSGPVSPPVLSIKPVRLFQESSSQSSSSPSPSSPPPSSQSPANETVTLTGQKLLKELGLPATLASFRLLISLGVLDENLLPSSLLAPVSAPASSPPPYVPPHVRRQASVPPSSPVSSSLPAPASSPALESSSSVSPPLVRTVTVSKGCFYCHNKHPSGLPHVHRNHCPWFHYHLAVGTCHLNERGELCLGPKRDEGLVEPLPFWSSNVAQGEQVKRRTDGTEWDENVEKRRSNPVVFGTGGRVFSGGFQAGF